MQIMMTPHLTKNYILFFELSAIFYWFANYCLPRFQNWCHGITNSSHLTCLACSQMVACLLVFKTTISKISHNKKVYLQGLTDSNRHFLLTVKGTICSEVETAWFLKSQQTTLPIELNPHINTKDWEFCLIVDAILQRLDVALHTLPYDSRRHHARTVLWRPPRNLLV